MTASFLPNLRANKVGTVPLSALLGDYFRQLKTEKTNRVSRALRLLLRGCCSRQLTAGLPAVGRVIALSTRLVMACTASTFNWVRSRSSWRQKQKQNTEASSKKVAEVNPIYGVFFLAIKNMKRHIYFYGYLLLRFLLLVQSDWLGDQHPQQGGPGLFKLSPAAPA